MTDYILIRKGKIYQVINYNFDSMSFDYTYKTHKQVKRMIKYDPTIQIENVYKDKQVGELEKVILKYHGKKH